RRPGGNAADTRPRSGCRSRRARPRMRGACERTRRPFMSSYRVIVLSMKGRRILFQDPDPRNLRAAERALVATGAEVDIVQVGQLAEVGHVGHAVAPGGGAHFAFAHRDQPAPPSLPDPRPRLRRI